jgi:hypothetical protein
VEARREAKTKGAGQAAEIGGGPWGVTPRRIDVASGRRGKAERDGIGLVTVGAFAGSVVSGPRGKRLFSAIESVTAGAGA